MALVQQNCPKDQPGGKSLRSYMGRLKGAAKHCHFNLPAGQTCYMDKMILHTLVQGLEDASVAKDVMEEYATNNNLQNCHRQEDQEAC